MTRTSRRSFWSRCQRPCTTTPVQVRASLFVVFLFFGGFFCLVVVVVFGGFFCCFFFCKYFLIKEASYWTYRNIYDFKVRKRRYALVRLKVKNDNPSSIRVHCVASNLCAALTTDGIRLQCSPF